MTSDILLVVNIKIMDFPFPSSSFPSPFLPSFPSYNNILFQCIESHLLTYNLNPKPPFPISFLSVNFFYPEDGGSKFIQNTGTYLQNHTASHSRRPQS